MKKLVIGILLGGVIGIAATAQSPRPLLGPVHTIGLEDGTRIIIEAEYAMPARAMSRLLRDAAKIMDGQQ
jgi:hypothetical protein